MRVFSGIQATGAKHIGNYIGAMRQYVSTQDEGDAFFCIVDLHSITVDYDPQDLHERTLDLAALLFAVGLDPERCTLFLQSHVTGARRGGVAALGRHRVRATRPHDAVQGEGRGQGVRLRRPLHLPGADGGRHPALPDRHRPDRRRPAAAPRARRATSRSGSTRASARRSRCRRVSYPTVGARIMDLQEPTKKMSTTGGSEQGTVLVLDPPDVIRKKFKTAVTDSGREVRYGPTRSRASRT